ncbi:MAG: SDR family NAD(P)-dependent oxidoreductase [Solirubrobacterales bacterium]|nr:SDR family NAD(P)-dependent oxidoreductase [Solirubrobacterales bacterium]OJU94488.1 MAG: oxidoreductase [Solirubrobacterales bacterium 67-14]
MADRLEGAVALVTGASSGIGEATARALAAQGAKVALVARRTERIEKLAQEIAGRGHTALAVEADVTDQRQAIAAVERAAGDFGRLDIVVNNAGVMLLGPIHGAPTEEWDRMIDVNLKGLLYTTHAALPYLFKAQEDSPRGVADVVNISSVAGRVATAGAGVYNLTKHGVGAVSEALRQEASRHGVRVTIIEPGFVETELQGHNRPEVHEKLKERTAKVEPLQAHDIADAIEYAVTRPAHVSLNELLIRPTTQP